MSRIEPFNQGRTWDELPAGTVNCTESRTITETDLVNFIGAFGFNETLFMDARESREKGFSGRLVPAALTYCVAEGLILGSHVLAGTGRAFLSMHLDVTKPVFVGDTIYAIVEITESRPTSKGDSGIVTSRVSVRNQDDVEVMVFTPSRLVAGSVG